MKRNQPASGGKRQLDFGLASVRVEFASSGATSLFIPVVIYTAVRLVAKLATALLWMSASMAFLTTIVWLAAAIYLFVVVTWLRDDNWLGAGILIAATFLGGGLTAEVFRLLVAPGAFSDVVLAIASSFLQMFIRSLLLVPLAGGLVAGARWVTGELRRSGAWSS
jgi:hypothetical protein